MSAPVEPWALGAAEVAEALDVAPAGGLSGAEAARRLGASGPNEIAEAPRRAAWLRLAMQFANTLSGVLAAAAVVTAAIGDLKDTVVIAAVLVLDATVGFVQEGRAERAVELLRQMSAQHCRARRDGAVCEVAVARLVPGDIVLLEQGDVVPADLRLVEAWALMVHEAALTGEAEPVLKSLAACPPGPVPVAERFCMAFKGTAVTAGRGEGVVTATGMSTELGRIAELLQTHAQPLTPLQRRLAVLGRRLAAAAIVLCAGVFVVGLVSGESVRKMFLTAISLAVAAIPEGLPAVVTVALALGARRMAARRAIIRRLPAVETLGSVTVICTDKTGTLTANEMVVERAWTPLGSYRVTGGGYAPLGDVVADEDQGAPGAPLPEQDPDLRAGAQVAAACNDATLRTPTASTGTWSLVGDPTEGALLAFAEKVGVHRDALVRARPRVAEIGFDSARRRMTTIHVAEDGAWVAVKGALAALVPLLRPSAPELVARAEAVADEWARRGLRVLALGEAYLDEMPADPHETEERLRLVGLVGITDPPRPEAVAAIEDCRRAGIAAVMITGDHPLTASAIAGRIGIATEGTVCTGGELESLDEEGLAQRVATARIYARVSPEQKLRIVQALQARHAVVAMTGDGVNDAPALRLADIGVAMGQTGTDVSKEAADMVLADDNFATIVAAVEEGRRIYDNIRRVVRYLLATNSAEVLVMVVAPLLGLPLPLIAVQILWINLVTDGAPAIALGLEPAEPDVLARPPRPPRESILGQGLWQYTVIVGTVMAAIAIAVQAGARSAGWAWQTMVFTTLALLQLANAWAMRSPRSRGRAGRSRGANPWLAASALGGTAAQLLVVYLPGAEAVFGTRALGAQQLVVVAGAVAAGYLTTKLAQRLVARRSRRNAL